MTPPLPLLSPPPPLLQFYHDPLNPRRHPFLPSQLLMGSDWLPKLTADLHGAAYTAVVPAALVVSLAATVALDALQSHDAAPLTSPPAAT